ncbi:hypothetical protein TVAG_284330 [Trichomonas vaginalis G3]|uniref:Right handed beta helix domain-containing protein n=1 Tax=Trichomonas vaginalis (strain ATCC PRA-98 / G3) TaxID=412133 RepID=A2EN91_TRIV3|nr:pectin lyase-like family [Trichomonas vaginalis G3]EAY05850.1 hypothetical protein TVAG_284330 [Trichomonas vaginalis G3]KAI5531632.1 pectin lyase-like family [Trichomonas vaginalis G3]|eukprot:XP_001318073.1 hypothetical protein [Trichomonas vaginalis G3]
MNAICMLHWQTPDSFVKNSIFKNNTAKISKGGYGLITSSSSPSNVTVSECIFIGNKADHTFSCESNGIITVIHCRGDDLSASKIYGGSFNTDKIETDPFDLPLSLLSLGKCEAENPISIELILNEIEKKNSHIFDEFCSLNLTLECFLNLKRS